MLHVEDTLHLSFFLVVRRYPKDKEPRPRGVVLEPQPLFLLMTLTSSSAPERVVTTGYEISFDYAPTLQGYPQ
jgi:hypothetical protein